MVKTNGSYIYTPNPDFNGGDSFTFTANDGAGGSDTATVTLTVNAVNDAPVAQDGSASGNEDTPISGTVVATDVDGLTLTYALGVQAANGTVVVNTDGTYTYTPKPNFNGTDSFTFTANDGAGGSDTATITPDGQPGERRPGGAVRRRRRRRGHDAQWRAGRNRRRRPGPDLCARHAGIAWNRRGQPRRHRQLHAGPGLQRQRQLHLHRQ